MTDTDMGGASGWKEWVDGKVSPNLCQLKCKESGVDPDPDERCHERCIESVRNCQWFRHAKYAL